MKAPFKQPKLLHLKLPTWNLFAWSRSINWIKLREGNVSMSLSLFPVPLVLVLFLFFLSPFAS